MAVLFSPWGNQQFFDDNGDPATGWKIFTYAAGSSTPLATYTTSAGSVAQSNPIIIDSLGFPAVGQIWITSGLAYKLVLTNASNVVKKTEDNITGVTGTSTTSQWQASGLAPTYVSPTSFTLAGDQTSDFHVQRRLQSTNTSGTIYSTITATAYTTLTTVTVLNDSGALDSGLSAVNLGLLTAVNPSVPTLYARSGANSDITSLSGLTTPLSIAQGGTAAGTAAAARTSLGAAASGANGDITSLTGLTTAISGTSLGNKIQPISASVASNALTLTLNPTTLDFRSATLGSGAVNARALAAAITLVVPSTATLGTVSAVSSRLILLAIDNTGTVELAVINMAGGTNLDETTLISTTAISASASSSSVVYSTTARTSVTFRVVGYVDSTQATAGTWATAPSTIQGAGGQSTIPVAMNAAGAAPMYACRAWVNFNGTGTVAIRASGNVSSITDNGTGDYTINFTTAMPSVNYAPVFGNEWSGIRDSGTQLFATASLRFITGFSSNTSGGGTSADSAVALVAIFH